MAVAAEQEAELLIVSSEGMSRVSVSLVGSVANKVSHHAPCSVLIVRRESDGPEPSG